MIWLPVIFCIYRNLLYGDFPLYVGYTVINTVYGKKHLVKLLVLSSYLNHWNLSNYLNIQLYKPLKQFGVLRYRNVGLILSKFYLITVCLFIKLGFASLV